MKGARIAVKDDWTGSRLDRFVRASRPELSFPVVQTLIRKGKILLNGEKSRGSARLKDGDMVEILIERSPSGRREKEGTPPAQAGRFGSIGREIPVLYEDADLLVIDKPSGLPVQPGNRCELGSVLDLLKDYIPADGSSVSPPPPFNPSPVHRLDLGTSGVLVIAKTRRAARALSRSLSEGEAVKTYLTVTEGVPPAMSGTIDTPLAVLEGDSPRTAPDSGGKQAVTHYRLLREIPGGRALLEVRIETGRKHQIRAHLSSIGLPVAGDALYGAPGTRPRRMLLHAWKIRFRHPASGDEIEVVSRPPSEFCL